MRNDKIFPLLMRVAESSDHNRYQLAAAVVIRGRVISFGYNRMKTDPMQAKYSVNKERIYMHAEIHAIKNALRHVSVDELKRATLLVLRTREDTVSGWGMAKPCEGCMRAIAEFGIKNVKYTNEQGLIDTI